MDDVEGAAAPEIVTRGYQLEMLEESFKRNIIAALDTGSGKTHIAVLRMKIEIEREPRKVAWFIAPTVTLCEQQRDVIKKAIPAPIGLINGALEPNQWKDPALWRRILKDHRIVVSTPQVLLDALRHAYIDLSRDISLIIFDEAHHAIDDDPYNRIMIEFYHKLPIANSETGSNYERPKILGLTASPIFGGNTVKALKTVEQNLDSVVRSPQTQKDELKKYVHRPEFKHVLYEPMFPSNFPPATNLHALGRVVEALDIKEDPYVQKLRDRLHSTARGTPDWKRLDQKLSKIIQKNSSYSHKGLTDFLRAGTEILIDLGPWATNWFVFRVLERAKTSLAPYQNAMFAWQDKEKVYLYGKLEQVAVVPVSYDPADIVAGVSDKVSTLIAHLEREKEGAETANERFSGLIFVTRRDSVLALAEILRHHPRTKGSFSVGRLLGTSESAYRQSFLDITRNALLDPQRDVLDEFRIGEKNLIVSTSVAEEGIDVQACGCVIRWDIPANMASYMQSRGRARKERSTFTVLFENGGAHNSSLLEWRKQEEEMIRLYSDPTRTAVPKQEPSLEEDIYEDNLELRVESTGALLSLQSAIPHLNHFCSVIPAHQNATHSPIYDIDPPDLPENWHSLSNQSVPLYLGPFGATVTLPRSLPPSLRIFSAKRIYPTKLSARRHVAFAAYSALYGAGLVNDNLLPLTSVLEPELDSEVEAILKDVEKRKGTAGVAGQMDPWISDAELPVWYEYEIGVGALDNVRLLTQAQLDDTDGGPLLYGVGDQPARVTLRSLGRSDLSKEEMDRARVYTRRLFWTTYGHKMTWNDLDFAYLIMPQDNDEESVWEKRRAWGEAIHRRNELNIVHMFTANAEKFANEFGYTKDIALIRISSFGKPYRFLRWNFNALSQSEEEALLETYKQDELANGIPSPLLVVEALPQRVNFLHPLDRDPSAVRRQWEIQLIPALSKIELVSPKESKLARLLPSILRGIELYATVDSLRNSIFSDTPLANIPSDLLLNAITAPTSQSQVNYERLETLGDTVLKFVTGIQLFAEYPFWHEGYLTKKKDHAVSNVRLAKDAIAKELYRWIIRNRFVPRKWNPKTLTIEPVYEVVVAPEEVQENDGAKKKTGSEQLSTKMLADVVEALTGAAYLHGSFDLAIDCIQVFGLGLPWKKVPERVEQALARVENLEEYPQPDKYEYVETMLGYAFKRKLLLIEALTHSSHQFDLRTVSYERMEFLGDSVLDMIVTEFLYNAPGKNYSPGHMHMRKSAVVSAGFLAYICLSCAIETTKPMPRWDNEVGMSHTDTIHKFYLWQCLSHSSPTVLSDQENTLARFLRDKDTIKQALETSDVFPWAALTRLQAPKFFSDMIESILGAIYLDSDGSWNVIKAVLRKLGILQVLERIVRDDVDVLHPVSQLHLWEARNKEKVEYEIETVKGQIVCAITVNGVEQVRVAETLRGRKSKEEVKLVAAEQLIRKLRLRGRRQKSVVS